MDKSGATQIFEEFLAKKEKEIGLPFAVFDNAIERIPDGWVFRYQGRDWVASRDMSDFLVGHGPAIVLDSGEVVEGGSLDRDPNDVVRRHFAERQ